MDQYFSYFSRFIKALLLAIIMFFSIRYLGFNYTTATAFSVIPLALGFLNIMTRFVYSMTALIFVAAMLSTIVEDEHVEVLKNLTHVVKETITKGKPE